MGNRRLPIDKLKQLIQLQSNSMSTREIGRALELSQGVVWKYLQAIRAAGIDAQGASQLSDVELEQRVWNAREIFRPSPAVLPDCTWIHTELKRHKHMTLNLLWQEYQAKHGESALRYSSFCERYRHWLRRLNRSMRQRHYAGEKVFVDYAGSTVPIYSDQEQESYRAYIFVAAVGASGYAYAEAT